MSVPSCQFISSKSNDTQLIMVNPSGKNGEEEADEMDGVERERNMPKASV